MAYLLSRMVRFRPGHGSHTHTSVRLLRGLNPGEDVDIREKVREVVHPLVTRCLMVVYRVELIYIFAVDLGVFKLFKLPTEILPSDRLLWRSVRLSLLPSPHILAITLLILLLQDNDLRDVSSMKLHVNGFHNLGRRNTVEQGGVSPTSELIARLDLRVAHDFAGS